MAEPELGWRGKGWIERYRAKIGSGRFIADSPCGQFFTCDHHAAAVAAPLGALEATVAAPSGKTACWHSGNAENLRFDVL